MIKAIFLLLFLSACASAPTSTIPILNLAKVQDGIYRGAQPNTKGVQFLRQLGVRTILDLNNAPGELAQEMQDAMDNGIRVISIPLSGFVGPVPADEDKVQAALRDPSLRPIFVHCEHGADRTGLAIALFRVKHDNWIPQVAHDEWMRYGHSKLLFLMDSYFWAQTRQFME
jgi:protein tyrosine/serine phosphatase